MKRLIAFALAATLLLSLPAAARYTVKKTINLGAIGTSPHSLAFNPVRNKIYCSNTGSGSISVIDVVQDSLLANVPVTQPGEMVYAQGSDRLFVHDINTELWAISGSGDTVEAYTSIGQGWCDLAYNQLRDRLYVSNPTDGLAFYNSSNLAYLGYNTAVNGNIFFAEPIQKLYGVAGAQVYVIDGTSNAVIDSFAAPGIESNSLFVYNPNTQKLYVTTAQGDLVVVDAVNDDVITMLPLGAPLAGLAICPSNNAVYVALVNGNLAEVFPDETFNLYSTGGIQLSGVAYNPSDSLIYTLDYTISKGVNTMMLFDPLTQAFRDSVVMSGSNMYTNMVVDNQGDVYTADYMLDQAYAIGRVPSVLWRSNTVSGQWFDYMSWEYSDDGGGSWGNPDSIFPTGPADSTILIQAGHTVFLDIGGPNITVDELVVNGTLVQFGGYLGIADGPGVDMAVSGNFQFSGGTFDEAPSAAVSFSDYGMYTHDVNGGSIPQAQWQPLSILRLTQVQDQTPIGLDQNFGQIIWNCPDQFTDAVLPGGPSFSVRGLTVQSTGSTGRLRLISSIVPEVTISGDLLIMGSTSQVVAGGSGVRQLTITGDMTMNNCQPLELYLPAEPGICTLRLRGNYTYTVFKGGKGFTGPSGPDSAAVVFEGVGEHIYDSQGGFDSGYIDYIVESDNRLTVNSPLGLGSQGRFWLKPGAYLQTADIDGVWISADSGCIRNSGPRIYGPGAGFIFMEGPSPGQAGDAVAGNVSMIRAANSQGTTLMASVILSDSLLLEGPLATGPDTVFMSAGSTTSMLGGYVEGNLAKYFQAGSEYKNFEVGTAGGQYSPAELQLYNSTQPGYFTVTAFPGPHPMVDSMDQCLRRYWRISAPGIGFDNSEVTLNYLPEDFNSSFFEALHESAMAAGRYVPGPGWSIPTVLARNYNGTNDGGSITVSGGTAFGPSTEFTTGRNSVSIFTIQDTVPPAAPESLQIYGFNPSYWLSGPATSVPVGWINPYDSTGITRAFFKTYAPPMDPWDFTDSIIVVGGARDTFWLPVDTLNGLMPVYVWLRDGAGNVNYLNHASIDVRRDTVAPAGATVKPFPSDTSYVNSFTVNWSSGSDILSGIQAWRVLFQIDTAGAPWDTLAPFAVDTSMIFTGALVGYRYYFEAAACDSAYNWEPLIGMAEDSIFVAAAAEDTIPPYIVSTEPPDDTVNVALDASVSIQFSEPIHSSLFSYTMAPDPGGLNAVWSTDSTLVTIGHDAFQYSTTYTVRVISALDTIGLALVGPDSFNFTTLAVGDTVRPHVLWSSPSDGAVDVALNQPVVVGFSEPVDTSSFRFRCQPQNVTGWAVSWGGSNQVATLSHDNFAYGTTYTFRVDSIADLAGNPLDTAASANHPWSFTTVAIQTASTSWSGGAWRLFSLPMMPMDTSALAMLGDDLGAYSDTTWRLVGYKPNFGYIERPPLYPGYGYWLASAQNAAIDFQGYSLSGPQTAALDSGWNIIGNSFDTALALSGLRVRWNDGTPHELYYSDSLVNSVLRQVMWQYLDNTGDLVNNGYWDSLFPVPVSDMIQPWQGYAVYAARPCSLVMERFFKGQPAQAAPQRQVLWQMEISASMGLWVDRGLKVGTSPLAAAGYDRLDMEKPPLVSENLAVYLPHHDWGQGPCRRYLRDMRPPGSEQRWLVSIDAGESRPVDIDYRLSGALEDGFRIYLVDRRLGQALPVSQTGRLTMAGSGELEVIYTARSLEDLEVRPLAFGLTRIYPNPFRGRIAISYQLDRPGRTSLKIYNSLGQLAAVLVDGHREAGFHAAAWDGARAAAGVYLVRLESEGRTRVTKTVKLR